jgi:hypothetical protein
MPPPVALPVTGAPHAAQQTLSPRLVVACTAKGNFLNNLYTCSAHFKNGIAALVRCFKLREFVQEIFNLILFNPDKLQRPNV